MAAVTGMEEAALIQQLQGHIYRDLGSLDPSDMDWAAFDIRSLPFLTADAYLSGDVRHKLRQANALLEGLTRHSPQPEPETLQTLQAQILALQAVQPKDLEAGDIEVRLGSTWIPPEVVETFMYGLLNTPPYRRNKIKVLFSPYTAIWSVTGKSADFDNNNAILKYGTHRVNAYKILEESLNLRDVRVLDTVTIDGKETRILNQKETIIAQQKQQAIQDAFQSWIWKDPERREQLVKRYNEKFNSIRPREYDGSHIQFHGMNPEIQLRPHQKNAVARILYGGNTLLGHVVGSGKTFTMAAAAMELKRLGLCHKPMFVVPNHLMEQWAREFLQLYPAANILVTTKRDFEKQNRQRFCSRIATGEYDAVIIGHSQFEKLPVSLVRQQAHFTEQIGQVKLPFPPFSYLLHLTRFRGNQTIQFRILLETVHEWNKRASVPQQPAARLGIGDVACLVFGDMEQLDELFRVPHGLIEHDHALGVGYHGTAMDGVQQKFHVLGGCHGKTGPFPIPPPCAIEEFRAMLAAQHHMEFIGDQMGSFAAAPVVGDPVDHGVCNHEGADGFQLPAQARNVVGEDPAVCADIGGL